MNRFTSWKEATLRSLSRNLLIHQSIHTTLGHAKAVQARVEQLITLAKKNDLSAKRQAFEVLGSHQLGAYLFKDIGPRFSKRTGGYTRIIPLGKRRGDNAEAVIFELTEIVKKVRNAAKKEKAGKTEGAPEAEPIKERQAPEKAQEKPPITQKPTKKFLGGLRNIFKKERDSL
jgi:large subunit ribosomal protein L17